MDTNCELLLSAFCPILLQNASVGSFELTADGEDFIDAQSRQKETLNSPAENSLPKSLKRHVSTGCFENPSLQKQIRSIQACLQEQRRSVATGPEERACWGAGQWREWCLARGSGRSDAGLVVCP